MRKGQSFCISCGTMNEKAMYIEVGGIRYFTGGNRREPDPKETSSYEFCCCGTPFSDMEMERASYCACCGRKRPKHGRTIKRSKLPAVKPVCKGPRAVRIAPAPEPRSVYDIAPLEDHDLITVL